MTRTRKFVITCFMLSAVISSSNIAIAASKSNSMLVTQPAYESMKFYVYKPESSKKIPAGFYVTYDGYLVYKNARGVWMYGDAGTGNSKRITKTNYIVGAVVPSTVGIEPYNKDISTVAPVLNLEENNSKAQKVIQTDWTQNPDFIAVSKWSKSVDKIGIINKPLIPVAWKGEHPDVIYAWAGSSWHQIMPRKWEEPVNTIRRNIHNLTVISNNNDIKWRDGDSAILEQYATYWGYQWIGELDF